MARIATSIEESKRLLKLGIDPNTADMRWRYNYNIHKHDDITQALAVRNWDDPYNKDIPAWSLTALLELMPRIGHLKPLIDLSPILDTDGVSIYYISEDVPYIVKDNLLDAVFEMVVWLKENGKI